MRITNLNHNIVQVPVVATASQKPHTSVRMNYVGLVSAVGMTTVVVAGISEVVGLGALCISC